MGKIILSAIALVVSYSAYDYLRAGDPATFVREYSHCQNIACAGAAMRALQLEDEYITTISGNDKVNSTGKALNNIQGYLIQDRANFHRFNKADSYDEPDSSFTTPDARIRMATMIQAGYIDPALENAAQQGDVQAQVFVFNDRVYATLKSGQTAETLPNTPPVAGTARAEQQDAVWSAPLQEKDPTE